MERIETPEEFADRYWRSIPPKYSDTHKMLADQVAARDAALLREAGDRAEAYMQRGENSGYVLKGFMEFWGPGLRAAIEGEE